MPLTTYITCGEHALPSRVQQKVSQTGGEVCPNLFYIGPFPRPARSSRLPILTLHVVRFPTGNSVLKTSEGLKIGSLSTLVSPSERNSFLSSPHLPSLQASSSGQPSLAQLQQAAKQPPSEGLDILLLPSPPTKLFATSPTAPAGLKAVEGDGALEEIVRRSRSRYILFPPTSSSSSDDTQVFFEREPFPASTSGTQSQDGRYSRAIQLGRFAVPQAGSTIKPVRSFYAFNLSPLVPPFAKPANATMNPFLSAGAGQKREREALEDQGFIWGKMGGGRGGQGGKRGRGGALTSLFAAVVLKEAESLVVVHCRPTRRRRRTAGEEGADHDGRMLVSVPFRYLLLSSHLRWRPNLFALIAASQSACPTRK